MADQSVKALTSGYGPDNSPVVSPDGEVIAYGGYDGAHRGYTVSKIYIMNRDGSRARKASPTWEGDVAEERWAADGKGIYFLSDSNGNTGFYYTAVDGVVEELAGKPTRAEHQSWCRSLRNIGEVMAAREECV